MAVRGPKPKVTRAPFLSSRTADPSPAASFYINFREIRTGGQMDWPGGKVTKRKVSSLVPSAQNARTHTEAQIAQIGASITEWGWTIPVLVDEVDTILAGHGRVLAAQLLGLDNIPVMVAKGWSEEQKRAYVLAASMGDYCSAVLTAL